jgi:hypothetical protein
VRRATHFDVVFVRGEPLTSTSSSFVLTMSYAVALMNGIRTGESWFAHLGDLAAQAVFGAIVVALSAKIFRWE